jgi:hypothetical protein
MITFNLVEEEHGWAVRTSAGVSIHFRLRGSALNAANRLADSVRRHGETVSVVIVDANPNTPAGSAFQPGLR